jgi:hypothetical protein
MPLVGAEPALPGANFALPGTHSQPFPRKLWPSRRQSLRGWPQFSAVLGRWDQKNVFFLRFGAQKGGFGAPEAKLKNSIFFKKKCFLAHFCAPRHPFSPPLDGPVTAARPDGEIWLSQRSGSPTALQEPVSGQNRQKIIFFSRFELFLNFFKF